MKKPENEMNEFEGIKTVDELMQVVVAELCNFAAVVARAYTAYRHAGDVEVPGPAPKAEPKAEPKAKAEPKGKRGPVSVPVPESTFDRDAALANIKTLVFEHPDAANRKSEALKFMLVATKGVRKKVAELTDSELEALSDHVTKAFGATEIAPEPEFE